MTLVQSVSIFLVVQHSKVSRQETVELGIMVILGTITSSKPLATVAVIVVEFSMLVGALTTGLLLLTLLCTLISSTSTQVLFTLRSTPTVLTLHLSVRLPVPDNLYTTEILMQ